VRTTWAAVFGILSLGLLAGCSSPSAPAPGPVGSSPEAIVGSWQGSSRCVNLELAPACKDETVIFDAKKADAEGAIALTGSRLVDGKPEPMGGPLEFKYDGSAGCWRTEFETPRLHGAWCLEVRGDDLTGSFDQIPGGAIREVVLKRVAG